MTVASNAVLETETKYEIEVFIPSIKLQPSEPEEGEWWRAGWGYTSAEEARSAVVGNPTSRVIEVVTTRKVVE